MEPVLSVRDLEVAFRANGADIRAVRGVDFSLHRGETLGLVGESGSGKSATLLSILGLIGPPEALATGEAFFGGANLLAMSPKRRRAVLGSDIAIVFQDPMSSLNPVLAVGPQIVEVVRAHRRELSRKVAVSMALDAMDVVGIPEPEQRYWHYPHELSGGLQQRVMIAMAMVNEPQVIFADEPTTALDVTIQAQVLEALFAAQRVTGAAMVLVSHDLGVVAEFADNVTVMYAGRVVEQAPVRELFAASSHPYTAGLLASLPRVDRRRGRLQPIPGSPPDAANLPSGCPFEPRCNHSRGRQPCVDEEPPLRQIRPTHWSACHFAQELAGDGETATALSQGGRS